MMSLTRLPGPCSSFTMGTKPLRIQRYFWNTARDSLLTKVAKTGTSLSANFPKFSGDIRLSVGDSVLVAKRYNKSKSQV